MASFGAEVEHTLGQEAAIERLRGFVEKVQESSTEVKDMKGEWTDNVLTISFRTFGMNISAKMAVEETQVVVDGTIPFAAIAFRGKIEQSIASKLKEVLA